ncbi:MAG: magnesium transporter [Deltaproteobacteria bacterium]|nr:magnesium transporter [Deltaproteobacteria bacterium]
MFSFFTELVHCPIVDRAGRFIGRPYDFCVRAQEPYPMVTALVIGRNILYDAYALVPWEQVHIAPHNGGSRLQFQLKCPREQIVYRRLDALAHEFRLRRHVLDQQVVDTFNRKVVRVNDIHLFRVDQEFRVAHVDIGIRGIVRRLGFERLVDRCVKLLAARASYLTREGFIGWKYIQPLAINAEKGTIALTVPQQDLRRIPPADFSEILTELDPYQRVAFFRALDVPTQGNILSEMGLRFQKEVLAEMDAKVAVEIFERMPPDKGADLLQEMTRREADRLLGSMSSRKAKKLSQLLAHKSRSAGGLMTTDCVTLPHTATVAEAIDLIKGMTARAETLYYAYIVDAEHRLEGTLTVRDLLVADPQQPIAAVMTPRPIAVHVDDSAKEVAYVLDRYNFFAIPVIDHDRVLQGIITIDDVLSLVIAETWGKKTGLL